MRRPSHLLYSSDERPPFWELILLGLQYTCMMVPYLIIIIILHRIEGTSGDRAISFSLIALAIAVLLQAIKKGQVGSGYLAPSTLSSIYFPASILAVQAGGMSLVYGMTLIGGFSQCFFSCFLEKLRKFFPPVVSGLIMAAVGLQLGLLALSQVFGNTLQSFYDRTLLVGLISLLTMIPLTIWAKGIWRLLSPFFGIVVGFLLSYFLGILSLEKVSEAPWLAAPSFQHSFSFSTNLLLPFILAGIAASLRTVGGITTSQKIEDEEWSKPDMSNLRKGLLADGISCTIGAGLGSPAVNVAPSLIGVAQATGATSRVIAFSLAAWLVLLAFLPKAIFLFLAIPLSVMSAALLFTASFMIAGGIEVIASRKVDTRSVIIIGISLLLGLGQQIFPAFFKELPSFVQIFTGSLLSIVTLTAFFLNLIFRIGIRSAVVVNGESEKAMREKLEKLGEEWRLQPSIISRMTTSASALSTRIRMGYLKQGELQLTILIEPVESILKFQYMGSSPKLRFDIEEERELIEETPYVIGLSSFLTGITADNIYIEEKDRNCTISLHFQI